MPLIPSRLLKNSKLSHTDYVVFSPEGSHQQAGWSQRPLSPPAQPPRAQTRRVPGKAAGREQGEAEVVSTVRPSNNESAAGGLFQQPVRTLGRTYAFSGEADPCLVPCLDKNGRNHELTRLPSRSYHLFHGLA